MKIYSLPDCTNCNFVKEVFLQKKIPFEEVCDEEKTTELGKKHNISTAPIIEIDGKFFDSLHGLEVIKSKYAL